VNPARILGVPGGTLAVGTPATFGVRRPPVDGRRAAVPPKGKNTPFDGLVLARAARSPPSSTVAVVFEHGRVLPREEVTA